MLGVVAGIRVAQSEPSPRGHHAEGRKRCLLLAGSSV